MNNLLSILGINKLSVSQICVMTREVVEAVTNCHTRSLCVAMYNYSFYSFILTAHKDEYVINVAVLLTAQ